MAIYRWAPLREVAALQNRMNSLLQDFSRGNGNDELVAAGFVPPVDIYEDEQRVVLKLEVPGLKEEDLDIRVENNTLTVRGERKFEKEEKEENFRRIERRYGSFYRAFTLPPSVDTDKVQAKYDAGVLRIELERRAEAKPKQVKIGVTSSNGQKPVEANTTENKSAA
jgi:HSP20 family protein